MRKVEQAWVDGKLDQLDQYFASDYPFHDQPPGVPEGLAGAKMMHQNVMKMFQNRKLEVKDIFAGGGQGLRPQRGQLDACGGPARDPCARGRRTAQGHRVVVGLPAQGRQDRRALGA